MAKRVGMLTPSSNTTLEQISCEVLAQVNVDVHFSRFRVVAISDLPEHLAQFAFEPMVQAAELLADAQCDLIVWNGTSGGWLGLDVDQQLCEAITARTGIPALTTLQAQLAAFERYGVSEVGLAVPYEESIVTRISQTFESAGVAVPVRQYLGLRDNCSFAQVPSNGVRELIEAVLNRGMSAVSVFCTNFAGARLVEPIESASGSLIFDSVLVTLWAALQQLGIDQPVTGWGRLLAGNFQ